MNMRYARTKIHSHPEMPLGINIHGADIFVCLLDMIIQTVHMLCLLA